MQQNVTALERAFQLARSGKFSTVSGIRKNLKREGYHARAIEGPRLWAHLGDLIEVAEWTARALNLSHRPAKLIAAADAFAAKVLPLIEPLRAEGKSLEAIATVLQERDVPTARGGRWTAFQVVNILGRRNPSTR